MTDALYRGMLGVNAHVEAHMVCCATWTIRISFPFSGIYTHCRARLLDLRRH